MANRCQLFSLVKQPKQKIQNLSEWNWTIPIVYKVLLSGNPEAVKSLFWQYDQPIAIRSDFGVGYEFLLRFLEVVGEMEGLQKREAWRQEIEYTKTFLCERKGDYFFFEPGEILELKNQLYEKQVEEMIQDILETRRILAPILEKKDAKILKSVTIFDVDEVLKLWPNTLGFYWTDVLSSGWK